MALPRATFAYMSACRLGLRPSISVRFGSQFGICFSDLALAMEEVHTLRENALKCVHLIINTLRDQGVSPHRCVPPACLMFQKQLPTSYQIMVASSDQVLLRALPPHQKLLQSDDLLYGLEIPKTLGR